VSPGLPEVLLREHGTADPSDHPALRGLWPDTDAIVRDMAALPGHALRIEGTREGLRIHARQHVGVVRLGSIQVRIRPRLPPGDLWTAIGFTLGLDALDPLPDAELALDGDFLELLCALLLREAERLWASGIHRGYIRDEAWRTSPRGRPDLTVLARHQPLRRAALPCRFHAFSAAVPANQLVVAGLGLARGRARRPALRGALHRAWQQWSATVGHAPLSPSLLQSATRTRSRLTARYDPAHTLVRLLAEGRGIGELEASDAAHHRVPGFLWNMASLWEAFLTRFLDRFLPGVVVRPQRSLGHLFHLGAAPSNWRSPRPRPDLVLERAGRPTLVVDAKYRDLLRDGMTRDVLYQLSVYALAWSRDGREVPALAISPTRGDPDTAHLELRPPDQPPRRILARGVRWDAALQAIRRGDGGRCRDLAQAWTAT
jgi:5-methylcytosine-specific restriction enzyme subunit McrC